jgi:decaprenyl-phosphate phosphoribosyltransferase
LYLGGAALALLTGEPLLLLVLAAYVAITLSYSFYFKNIATVDLLAVASGFLLRTVAGAVATDVVISDFFLIVAAFGSVFLVAGKRHAEYEALGPEAWRHRRTLGRYSLVYLAQVRAMAAAVTMLAYCQWALERGEGMAVPWFELSIVPFVVAVLRYELLVGEGHGGAPEEVFRHNRPIQVLGATWAFLVLVGIYAG